MLVSFVCLFFLFHFFIHWLVCGETMSAPHPRTIVSVAWKSKVCLGSSLKERELNMFFVILKGRGRKFFCLNIWKSVTVEAKGRFQHLSNKNSSRFFSIKTFRSAIDCNYSLLHLSKYLPISFFNHTFSFYKINLTSFIFIASFLTTFLCYFLPSD